MADIILRGHHNYFSNKDFIDKEDIIDLLRDRLSSCMKDKEISASEVLSSLIESFKQFGLERY
jgi:hypothetical protein